MNWTALFWDDITAFVDVGVVVGVPPLMQPKKPLVVDSVNE